MRAALEIVAFIAAAALVGATLLSAIRAVVLPRAAQGVVPALAIKVVRAVLAIRSRRLVAYNERDRVMAMLGPIALVLMLVTWLLILFFAYAVMYFCLAQWSVGGAIRMSGSSLVTLGTTSDHRFWPSLLSYSEAGMGLLLVALFISYFPSIYSAFTRREAGVTLLEVRAGSPPQPTTMLIRYHQIEGRLRELTELWRSWEAWFADVDESHSTFPVVAFFRSPVPERSWITAAGVVLDGAALWLACIQHPKDPDAQLTLRAGYLALRRIADGFGITYDREPAPDDPISITRQEWDEAMDKLDQAGVPLLTDREQAWRDWAGWRVNYDTVLLRIARAVEAPPVPWVSDRSPIGVSGHSGRIANAWQKARRR